MDVENGGFVSSSITVPFFSLLGFLLLGKKKIFQKLLCSDIFILVVNKMLYSFLFFFHLPLLVGG